MSGNTGNRRPDQGSHGVLSDIPVYWPEPAVGASIQVPIGALCRYRIDGGGLISPPHCRADEVVCGSQAGFAKVSEMRKFAVQLVEGRAAEVPLYCGPLVLLLILFPSIVVKAASTTVSQEYTVYIGDANPYHVA